jgi:hypothetical protein
MHGSGIAPFLPAHRRARAKRLGAGREAIIQQATVQHYATPTRPSLQSLANQIARSCKEVGLAPHAVKAPKARVTARNQVWLVRRREGAGKARSPGLLQRAETPPFVFSAKSSI